MRERIKILHIVVLFCILLLLGVGGVAFYFYDKYVQTQRLLENPTLAGQKETSAIVTRVGKLMILPKDEEPSLATVSDEEKIRSQAFFASARNGDKLLIYKNAKKAILYRPSANKIVEASFNIDALTPLPTQAPAATEPPPEGSASAEVKGVETGPLKIALYNGSTTVGVTYRAEKLLTEKVEKVEIVSKENAVKNDYENTIVVDLTGRPDGVQKVAAAVGGEIGQLPEGEAKPEADVVVIFGKSFK